MGPLAGRTIFRHLAMQRDSNQDAGYTLLEMLVVVAILSLVVFSAPTAYSVVVPNFQVRQFANEVANTARDLRRDAVREQSVKTLNYLSGAQTIHSPDRELEIPSGVNVAFNRTMQWRSVEVGKIEFYPTGGSSGGQFEIRRGGVSVTVVVDWVSGATKVIQ